MLTKLKALYQKNGALLRYCVVGGLTTVIDLAVFALCAQVLSIPYWLGKVIAWIFAVAFAFCGSKWVVFRTKDKTGRALWGEAGRFLAMRLATLAFAELFLYVTITLLCMHHNLANFLSNVFVVILNYLLSKLIVFKQ